MTTLAEAVDAWRARERERIELLVTDPETNLQHDQIVPAWLFRGERSITYKTTVSSFSRFDVSSGLPTEAQEEVISATKRLDYILQRFSLHPKYSAALLQHYFLPTELIDLTESLDDAAAFAAHGNNGEAGFLMAFETKNLQQHGIVVDLAAIHFAKRPRHQHAYVWFHNEEPDLKKLFELVKGEAVTFKGSAADVIRYERHYEDICGEPHTDATSGLLNKIFHEEVLVDRERKVRHTISAEALEWIEERIPWAPVPMRHSDVDPNALEPAWDKF